jgi:hypothetical protein
MSFRPFKLVARLQSDPELAMIATLDMALKQAACALLAQHQDCGLRLPKAQVTVIARSIITSSWTLRKQLQRYRAALARHYRSQPF